MFISSETLRDIRRLSSAESILSISKVKNKCIKTYLLHLEPLKYCSAIAVSVVTLRRGDCFGGHWTRRGSLGFGVEGWRNAGVGDDDVWF